MLRVRRTILLAGALATMYIGAPSLATQDADNDGFTDLVEALDDPSLETREQAHRRLSESEEYGLDVLEDALRSSELTPEQRRRLLTVARDRFLDAPRAGLGVQFDTSVQTRVVVRVTYEGFPCNTQLEPGDIMLEAGGQDLRTLQPFPVIQGLILSRDPGDTLPVLIRRGGDLIELELGLGEFKNIPGATTLDIDRKLAAWDIRSSAPRFGNQTPIGMDVPQPAPSTVREPPDMMDEARLYKLRKGMPVKAIALGAGQPRGGPWLGDDEAALADEMQFRMKQRQLAAVGMPRPAAFSRTVADDLAAVQRRLDDIPIEITKLRDRLAPGETPGDAMAKQLETLEAERTFRESLVRSLRAEAAGELQVGPEKP